MVRPLRDSQNDKSAQGGNDTLQYLPHVTSLHAIESMTRSQRRQAFLLSAEVCTGRTTVPGLAVVLTWPPSSNCCTMGGLEAADRLNLSDHRKL